MMVSIIEGTGIFEGNEVKKGDHFVICSDQKEVTFDGDMEVMNLPHYDHDHNRIKKDYKNI
mgnify:CR=1 FL=1